MKKHLNLDIKIFNCGMHFLLGYGLKVKLLSNNFEPLLVYRCLRNRVEYTILEYSLFSLNYYVQNIADL